MKKLINIILVVLIAIAFFVTLFHPDWIVGGLPKASAMTPQGCSNPTDTLLGYDEVTGEPICKQAPTGCPYGDSIPLDSAKCVAPAATQIEPAPVDQTEQPQTYCGK